MNGRRAYLGEWDEVVPSNGHTFLTPNEYAARKLGAEPVSLATLAMRTLGEERVAHPVVVQRLLRKAVQEALGSADPEGVARTLLPPIRELFRAGADVDGNPGSTRARRVTGVARTYRTLLRAQGLVDPAEMLWEAAATSPERRRVLVWGYARLGHDEVAFVDAVAGEGSVVQLPHAEDRTFAENLRTAEELGRRGWEVEQAPLGTVWEAKVPPEAHSYPNLEAEVRGVLAQTKALLADGISPQDVVLVARDDAVYGPTVLEVADEYGVTVQALYQVPLSDTRVGFWVLGLLGAMEDGFPFESTARILAHPLGPGMLDKQWARARKLRPRGIEAWEGIGPGLSLLAWPEEDTRQGWLVRFDALLEAYALKRKVASWPREVLALSNLKEAVGWLGDPAAEEVPREQFLREIDEILRAATTPAHPAREGVALHTPLALYGASYRYVFALGLVEGVFPPPVADDPALDFHERKRLRKEGIRLELAHERARRERLSFWTLLQVPRERLVLSYPRQTGRQEALPSPYFGLLGVEPVQPRALPAASLEEARRIFLQRGGLKGDAVLPHATRNWEVERRREGPDPFDAHDGALGIRIGHEERRFSVSELGDLARCGFRWWSGSVLGLSEPEEGEPPALLGRLYHKVLESATEQAKGDPDLRRGILDNLEAAFGEAERELEMPARVRGWAAWRAFYLAQLRNAVTSGGFALPGAEALEAEVAFSGEWQGFRVQGRVDRVDRTPEGLVFVDYKTAGSAPRPDLQLPIYREAAAKALFPGERVKDAYYYSLAKAERIRGRPPSANELADVAEEARASLEDGHLPPDVLQRACAFCDFDLVCRRGPRLGHKGGGG
ncbi:MAG: PD-(D/E)XK nuclease family protein [Actinomycetota bacterium]|nr:PD-(D/E)XK nuclease family protein [Actinomycetota bacterium]